VIRRLALAGLVVVAGAIPGMAWVEPVHAQEATFETQATYTVDPDARAIQVVVEATFTNSTPDPAGQITAFPEIPIGLQPGASEVTAEDVGGALTVRVEPEVELLRVEVVPRQPVRFQQSVAFTLRYRLADGAQPGLHVRSAVVEFAAWGFGTSSQVTVTLPDTGFEVLHDGDPLTASREEGQIVLRSGPIPEPAHWLARVVGTRPGAYETLNDTVPLRGGTVDLQVRAWNDDPAWGGRILALLRKALPRLETAFGLPYPGVGPLVVVEATALPSGGFGESSASTTELQVGFDADDFTALHQAAHVWIDDGLASDRWIREGLASHMAAIVAPALGVAPPYDPAVRSADLAPDAFPLVAWDVSATDAGREAYGYAAAWSVTDRVALAVGEERLRDAIGRIASGIGAYQPDASEPLGPNALPPRPVDSRRYLDQLEAVIAGAVASIFAEAVFEPAIVSSLGAREEARRAFAALAQAGGDWGVPEPVILSLTDWRFEEAATRIDAALGWVAEARVVVDEMAAAGLAAPLRLRDAYRSDGGGPDAAAELEAIAALVRDYQRARELSAAAHGPVEWIGLLGTDDPARLVDEAGALFADGNLLGASEAIAVATSRYQGATLNGVVRLAGAAAVLVAVLGLAWLLVRRRQGADYTAPT